MIRLLPWLVVLGLTIYALVDCAQSNDDAVRSLPKLVWVFLILLFPLVGAIAWLIAGRPERPGRQQPPRRGPTPPPRFPRGPDDDPDFLRRL